WAFNSLLFSLVPSSSVRWFRPSLLIGGGLFL
ncbi:hypothetical protein ACUXPX_002756, partial [Staphylococcus cohnii]